MRTKSAVRAGRFLAAMLAIVILSLTAVVVTYAEYTKSSRAKRVVASYEASGALFSSNFMQYSEGDNNTIENKRTLFTGAENQSVITTVSVCNFAQGNPVKYYDKDINYVMTAKLVYVNGTTKRAATPAEIGDLSVSIVHNNSTVTLDSTVVSHVYASQTLDHYAAHSDAYQITFSPEWNTDDGYVCLYLIAVPQNNYSDISPIDVAFNTGVSHERMEATWEGYFNEAGARGAALAVLPPAFDGFRYVIEGSGAGTFTLSWDNTAIEPSQIFVDEIVAAGGSLSVGATTSTLSFAVDSDVINRYDLQFYRVDADSDDLSSWAAVWAAATAYVTYTYTAD